MTRRTYEWRAQVAAELVGVAEIAERTGKSKATTWAMTRQAGFPEPVKPLAMGPVWLWSDVEEFLATPRRPGPKPKAAAPAGGARDALGAPEWALRDEFGEHD